MKNHYVYKITHILTGHFYIGIRSCDCPIQDDKYMGSGDILKSINPSLLVKEILAVTPDRSTAYAIETLIVNEHFLNREDTLNVRYGGIRGEYTQEMKEHIKEKIKEEKDKNPEKYIGRKPSYDMNQYNQILNLINAGETDINISKITGIKRQTVFRIRKDPKKYYDCLCKWS